MNAKNDNNLNTISNGDNREKIAVETFGLISWYATGWLSAEERARVHKLLKKHPALKTYLKDEQQIIQSVKDDKSILNLSALESTETRLERVLTQLDDVAVSQENKLQSAESPIKPSSIGANDNFNVASTSIGANDNFNVASTSIGAKSIVAKLNQFIQTLFSTNTNALKYASFASITLLVGLLVAFIAPMVNHSLEKQANTTFHPATVQTAETKKLKTITELLVGLNKSGTDNTWLDQLLQKNGAKLSNVPGKDGLYRIQFKRKLNPNEIKAILDQLNSHKESIWFSGEAY